MARLPWLLGALGVVAALAARALRRSGPARLPAGAEVAGESDPRAEELRRRLAESRALVEEREEFEAGETPVDRVEAQPIDPAERRRHVHEHGQAAIERMRRSDETA